MLGGRRHEDDSASSSDSDGVDVAELEVALGGDHLGGGGVAPGVRADGRKGTDSGPRSVYSGGMEVSASPRPSRTRSVEDGYPRAGDGAEDSKDTTGLLRRARVGKLYYVFILLGIGTLMPWNAITSAVDFFEHELDEHSNPELLFTVFFQVGLVITCSTLVFYGNVFTFKSRFLAGYTIAILALAGIPVATTLIGGKMGYFVALIAMFLFGISDGLTESSVYGFASPRGEALVRAAQVGQSASGFSVSLLRVITKLSFPDDTAGIQTSAYVFFGVSALVCVACVLVFVVVPSVAATLPEHSVDRRLTCAEVVPVWTCAKMVISLLFANYLLTLFIFPGFLVGIQSSYGIDAGWFSVVLLGCFNAGDCLSRYLGTKPSLVLSSLRKVLWVTVGRVVFLVFFIYEAVEGSLWDPLTVAMAVLLGLTHGLLSVNLFVMAPEVLPPKLREEGGYVMTLSMVAGIALGIFSSLGVHALMDPSSV